MSESDDRAIEGGAPRPQRSELRLDGRNANRGTARGREALARSLREYGAGRSVLVDREGRVIAGNKTVEQARMLGIPVKTVDTDGQELVAVRRTDLDLVEDDRARALNRRRIRKGLILLNSVNVKLQICTTGSTSNNIACYIHESVASHGEVLCD